MRYYRYTFRMTMVVLASAAMVLAWAACGSAQISGAEMRVLDPQEKPTLHSEDAAGRKEVPFSSVLEPSAHSSGARGRDNTVQTIVGLKEAGYHLEAIVGFLKAGGKNASEISHACLQQGFQGNDLVIALKLAGFTNEAAEDAVPKALRSERPQSGLLSVEELAGLGSVMGPALGEGTDIVSLGIQQQAVITRSRVMQAQPENSGERRAPGQDGGKQNFDGLGNWNRFQDERFDSFKK